MHHGRPAGHGKRRAREIVYSTGLLHNSSAQTSYHSPTLFFPCPFVTMYMPLDDPSLLHFKACSHHHSTLALVGDSAWTYWKQQGFCRRQAVHVMLSALSPQRGHCRQHETLVFWLFFPFSLFAWWLSWPYGNLPLAPPPSACLHDRRVLFSGRLFHPIAS